MTILSYREHTHITRRRDELIRTGPHPLLSPEHLELGYLEHRLRMHRLSLEQAPPSPPPDDLYVFPKLTRRRAR